MLNEACPESKDTKVLNMYSIFNHLTPNGHFSGRTTLLTYRWCIFLFIQQIYILNILNMLHTLRFFLFKMSFISYATFFDSRIVHIFYTGYAKI
jgi:hypothetical protein